MHSSINTKMKMKKFPMKGLTLKLSSNNIIRLFLECLSQVTSKPIRTEVAHRLYNSKHMNYQESMNALLAKIIWIQISLPLIFRKGKALGSSNNNIHNKRICRLSGNINQKEQFSIGPSCSENECSNTEGID